MPLFRSGVYLTNLMAVTGKLFAILWEPDIVHVVLNASDLIRSDNERANYEIVEISHRERKFIREHQSSSRPVQ